MWWQPGYWTRSSTFYPTNTGPGETWLGHWLTKREYREVGGKEVKKKRMLGRKEGVNVGERERKKEWKEGS